MKKYLFLLIGMAMLLAACDDSSEGDTSEEENNGSRTEEIAAEINSEEANTEEMGKRDALYYLEEITKSSLNISYLTDGDGEAEIKQLLTEGIDNIDTAIKDIEKNFNSEDPLTKEVVEVADFVKEASEKYLDDNDFEALSNASGEIGYMVGVIARNYLDKELPPTIARVSEDFSEVDESESNDKGQLDKQVNEELEDFIEEYNRYGSQLDGFELLDPNAFEDRQETEFGTSQVLHSSDDYVIRVAYDSDNEINSFAVGVVDNESGNAFSSLFFVGEVLGINNDSLVVAMSETLDERRNQYNFSESGYKVTIFNELENQSSELTLSVWFEKE